jgi:hypothetical protein
LEQAHPDDGLLPLLSLGGQPVQSLVVLTTQMLPATHQHILHLLMVSCSLCTATVALLPPLDGNNLSLLFSTYCVACLFSL